MKDGKKGIVESLCDTFLTIPEYNEFTSSIKKAENLGCIQSFPEEFYSKFRDSISQITSFEEMKKTTENLEIETIETIHNEISTIQQWIDSFIDRAIASGRINAEELSGDLTIGDKNWSNNVDIILDQQEKMDKEKSKQKIEKEKQSMLNLLQTIKNRVSKYKEWSEKMIEARKLDKENFGDFGTNKEKEK
jgi:hypothetical protein